jgi:peptidoglycan/xylan/chitin deacetylase (PgdA/CDA1 family)
VESKVLSDRVAPLRILAYHAIADLSDDRRLAEYGVPPELFAAQLDSLLDAGWSFVDLDLALSALREKGGLPPRALLLTFDDGYVDLLEMGLPILAERGLPGVVFAVAGQLGGTNEWNAEKRATTLDLLDVEGLMALARQGVEVGAHASTHRPLTAVPAEELWQEVAGAAGTLEHAGLPRPRAFSYPYGDWNPAIADLARRTGYEVSVTVDFGVARPGADLHSLPRIEVHAGDTPGKLKLKLMAAGWPVLLRGAFLRAMGVRLNPSSQ